MWFVFCSQFLVLRPFIKLDFVFYDNNFPVLSVSQERQVLYVGCPLCHSSYQLFLSQSLSHSLSPGSFVLKPVRNTVSILLTKIINMIYNGGSAITIFSELVSVICRTEYSFCFLRSQQKSEAERDSKHDLDIFSQLLL